MTNEVCTRETYDWVFKNPNAAGVEIERLRAVLERVNEKLRTVVKPWEGVRADIIPPSVVAIVPLCNELHAALQAAPQWNATEYVLKLPARAAPQDWCQLRDAPCSTYPFCECGRVSPHGGV